VNQYDTFVRTDHCFCDYIKLNHFIDEFCCVWKGKSKGFVDGSIRESH